MVDVPSLRKLLSGATRSFGGSSRFLRMLWLAPLERPKQQPVMKHTRKVNGGYDLELKCGAENERWVPAAAAMQFARGGGWAADGHLLGGQ